jgi:hypothetical protein
MGRRGSRRVGKKERALTADNPTSIRLLVYASRSAYEAHLWAPHFIEYKSSTEQYTDFESSNAYTLLTHKIRRRLPAECGELHALLPRIVVDRHRRRRHVLLPWQLRWWRSRYRRKPHEEGRRRTAIYVGQSLPEQSLSTHQWLQALDGAINQQPPIPSGSRSHPDGARKGNAPGPAAMATTVDS